MRRIHKYPITEGFMRRVSIKGVVKVLHVAAQNGTPCIWVEFEENDNVVRSYQVLPTGGYPEAGARHVGSFLMDDGDLVWHVYEDADMAYEARVPEQEEAVV